MKYLLLLCLLSNLILSKDLEPSFTLPTSGMVTDMVLYQEKIYAATDASKVDIINPKTKKIIQSIQLPKIKDFMGDIINSKIYSVDVLNDKILILSQGERGGRNIYIYENNQLKNIISDKKRMFISKAKFINDKTITFGLLSNQIYLFDIINNKKIWDKQVSQSKFSNFVLNEDKSRLIIADESGDLKELEVSTGQQVRVYKNQNLDNVFQVDIKNGIIATAGQDRRCVIYEQGSDNAYYKHAPFLIYSVGLSPSGKLAGFAKDDQNRISIFNTLTKSELYLLSGHQANLTKILFINEKELYSSAEEKNIYYWKLKD